MLLLSSACEMPGANPDNAKKAGKVLENATEKEIETAMQEDEIIK